MYYIIFCEESTYLISNPFKTIKSCLESITFFLFDDVTNTIIPPNYIVDRKITYVEDVGDYNPKVAYIVHEKIPSLVNQCIKQHLPILKKYYIHLPNDLRERVRELYIDNLQWKTPCFL